MKRVTKRILTRKSILGFGHKETRDLSVQTLLDTGKRMVLIKAYYHLSKIDFTEEILDEIGVVNDLRISKPGKLSFDEAKVMIQKTADIYYQRAGERVKMNDWNAAQGKRRHSAKRNMVKLSISHNKESLRAKNHGNKPRK